MSMVISREKKIGPAQFKAFCLVLNRAAERSGESVEFCLKSLVANKRLILEGARLDDKYFWPALAYIIEHNACVGQGKCLRDRQHCIPSRPRNMEFYGEGVKS